jgi:hypothetical protein
MPIYTVINNIVLQQLLQLDTPPPPPKDVLRGIGIPLTYAVSYSVKYFLVPKLFLERKYLIRVTASLLLFRNCEKHKYTSQRGKVHSLLRSLTTDKKYSLLF